MEVRNHAGVMQIKDTRKQTEINTTTEASFMLEALNLFYTLTALAIGSNIISGALKF